MKIGVIGAMQMEVDNLQANMTDTKVVEYSGITFVEGKIDGKSVVAAMWYRQGICSYMCTDNDP